MYVYYNDTSIMNVHMFQGIETTLMYNLPTYDVGKLHVYAHMCMYIHVRMYGRASED